MTRDECLKATRTPPDGPWSIRYEGWYWRNLTSNEVKKRYAKDQGRPPAFGFRIKSRGWRWKDSDGQIGLSVNCRKCTCARCSITLHPHAEMYKHAVAIGIAELSEELGITVVAQYSPITEDGEENPCHFDLLPVDADIDLFLRAVHRFLDARDPDRDGVPNTEEEIRNARAIEEQQTRAIRLDRDVLDP